MYCYNKDYYYFYSLSPYSAMYCYSKDYYYFYSLCKRIKNGQKVKSYEHLNQMKWWILEDALIYYFLMCWSSQSHPGHQHPAWQSCDLVKKQKTMYILAQSTLPKFQVDRKLKLSYSLILMDKKTEVIRRSQNCLIMTVKTAKFIQHILWAT